VDRAYDLRDVCMEVKDYNDAPTFGEEDADAKPAPAPAPARKPKSRDQLMTELVELLRSVVPPKELEGGSMRPLADGMLAVRATPAGQASVSAVLEEQGQRFLPQVLVEAVVVRADAKSLEKAEAAAPGVTRKLRLASFDRGPRAGKPLTEAETDALRRAALMTAPRMALYSGQRAYVLSATQRAYVAAVGRKKDAAGREQFEPQVKTVQSGVVLDARATPARDGRSVALNGRVTLSVLYAMNDAPAPGVPAGRKDLLVQVPDYEKQVVEVNAVVPDHAYLLFAATDSARPHPGPAGARGAEPTETPVYAIVHVTVVTADGKPVPPPVD
jgi:hypothetical protein